MMRPELAANDRVVCKPMGYDVPHLTAPCHKRAVKTEQWPCVFSGRYLQYFWANQKAWLALLTSHRVSRSM